MKLEAQMIIGESCMTEYINLSPLSKVMVAVWLMGFEWIYIRPTWIIWATTNHPVQCPPKHHGLDMLDISKLLSKEDKNELRKHPTCADDCIWLPQWFKTQDRDPREV